MGRIDDLVLGSLRSPPWWWGEITTWFPARFARLRSKDQQKPSLSTAIYVRRGRPQMNGQQRLANSTAVYGRGARPPIHDQQALTFSAAVYVRRAPPKFSDQQRPAFGTFADLRGARPRAAQRTSRNTIGGQLWTASNFFSSMSGGTRNNFERVKKPFANEFWSIRTTILCGRAFLLRL